MPVSKTAKRRYERSKATARTTKDVKPQTDEQAMRLAEQDKRAGKAPTTQASHFVHEEIEHAKEGEHPVRNPRQAVAIGLSKARKHGIALPPRGRARKSK